jgi:hypothetical protein
MILITSDKKIIKLETCNLKQNYYDNYNINDINDININIIDFNKRPETTLNIKCVCDDRVYEIFDVGNLLQDPFKGDMVLFKIADECIYYYSLKNCFLSSVGFVDKYKIEAEYKIGKCVAGTIIG